MQGRSMSGIVGFVTELWTIARKIRKIDKLVLIVKLKQASHVA